MSRFRFRVFLVPLITILLLVTFVPAATAAEASPTHYTAGVHPALELLSGVLAHTSWIERQGPSGEGNEYYRALRAYFEPYREHRAIQLAEQLTQRGFTYDAPPAFIFHLGPLPELELAHEYSDYLVKRAGGRQALEDLREALADLARESDFAAFAAQWQGEYDDWWARRVFDGDTVIGWLEEFFGASGAEYHLVLAPAMFPGGGYGATVTTADGRSRVYQVVLETGQSRLGPVFQGGLEELAAHEWGHSYVNPAIDLHGRRVDQMVRYYRPVAQQMRAQAYSSVRIFMHEQVLRAADCLFVEKTMGPAALERAITYHEQRGFYLTRPVLEALRNYLLDRAEYPRFSDYVPRLLDQIEAQPVPDSPASAADGWQIGVGGVGALCVLLGGVWWIRRRSAKATVA